MNGDQLRRMADALDVQGSNSTSRSLRALARRFDAKAKAAQEQAPDESTHVSSGEDDPEQEARPEQDGVQEAS
jgi:hypothetical protein